MAQQLILTADATELHVATVTINTNNLAGYTLTVESTNAAADAGNATLKSVIAGSTGIGYTVTYTGTDATAAGDDPIPAAGLELANTSDDADDTGELQITYSGVSTDYPTGYYTDQLTLTLQAK